MVKKMFPILLLSVSILCCSFSLKLTSDVSPEVYTPTTEYCRENCFEFTSSTIPDNEDLNDLDQTVSIINSPEGRNLTPTIKCLPGQSAYTENDLKVIINEIIFKSQTIKTIHDSYYKNALILRDKYEQYLNEIEMRFEDRPRHLKHIMEEIVQMRQRVEPLAKHIYTKLNNYDSYEKTFNETQIQVNKLNIRYQKTLQICELNCKVNESNKEAVMRSRRYFEDSVYCSTYGELVEIIKSRLNLFQTELIPEIMENIKIDTNVLSDKIIMITNKLKEAGLKYFGITLFEILSLQDAYYHLWEDLKKSNVTKHLDEIKINNFKINSELVELEDLEIRAREYCKHCNHDSPQINVHLMTPTVKFSYNTQNPWLINRNHQQGTISKATKTILDRVLDDIIVHQKVYFETEYKNIFKDLKDRLDDTKIIAKYLTKLKPVRDDVANEVKNESKQFENIQNLIPKAKRDNVSNLLQNSMKITEFVRNAIREIKKLLILN